MSTRVHTADVRFDGDPADIRAARDVLRAALDASEWGGDLDAALLVVSELVTNAVVHAERGCRLHVEVDGRILLIEVADEGRLFGLRDLPPPWQREAVGGRGLAIVDAVAESWGIRGRDGDKCVWARLVAAPAPAAC